MPTIMQMTPTEGGDDPTTGSPLERITAAVVALDEDDVLYIAFDVGSKAQPRGQVFAGRCVALAAVVHLTKTGCITRGPLEDVADAAQRALTDADAVAAWVCAPLVSTATSTATLTTSEA